MPKRVNLKDTEIYFQDESRIGQQGSTTRIWAKKGSRPRVEKQRQFLSANIYGAVCPQKDKGFALILPYKDTEIMQMFLDEFSKTIPKKIHAVLVVDQASWHKTSKLKKPKNISLIFLPPYSPELNPIEQVWQFLKQRWLSNRCFKDYNDILKATSDAWKNFVSVRGAIKSLCFRKWATLVD